MDRSTLNFDNLRTKLYHNFLKIYSLQITFILSKLYDRDKRPWKWLRFLISVNMKEQVAKGWKQVKKHGRNIVSTCYMKFDWNPLCEPLHFVRVALLQVSVLIGRFGSGSSLGFESPDYVILLCNTYRIELFVVLCKFCFFQVQFPAILLHLVYVIKGQWFHCSHVQPLFFPFILI